MRRRRRRRKRKRKKERKKKRGRGRRWRRRRRRRRRRIQSVGKSNIEIPFVSHKERLSCAWGHMTRASQPFCWRTIAGDPRTEEVMTS